jgi:hypothetical protein
MDAGSISFADDPETQSVPTLLGWAMRRINPEDLDAVGLQWPTDTPKPETWPESRDDDFPNALMASELMLSACGWILHHEFAHVRAGDVGTAADIIFREREADRVATDYVLSKATDDEDIMRRGAGMAVALVAIAGYTLAFAHPVSPLRTHPHFAERLDACLSHPAFGGDHMAHQLAVDMLAIFVQRRGIEVPPGPFANPSEALREYCFALTRH